ncbi:MAG: MauE/DoxX family redox-associated membrane protein [Desulfovibrionaceae bacterium]
MSRLNAILGSVWVYRTARLALAVLFLVAGVIKLQDPVTFAITIDAFGLAPRALAMPLAIVLPVLEIAAAIGLLFDRKGSLLLTAGLTVLFLAVVGYGMWLGLDIDCGCYGPGDPERGAFSGLRTTFWRDMGMMAMVAYCYWWKRFGRRRAPQAA